MAEQLTKPGPWLIAAWPGMGNVAVIAASYLIQQLSMTESGDLAPGSHFDVMEVEVRDGLVVVPQLPRGVFFMWTNPGAGRNLVVFVGESQPVTGSYAYAKELLDAAARFGIERIITFASLASALHPSEDPKVSGIATDAASLEELRKAEVQLSPAGPIGGMNGLVIGAAAERGMSCLCLLAEIPFFAMNVPNPKAARAALSVLSVLAEIDISLESLNMQAAIVDRALLEVLEKMRRQRDSDDDTTAERDAGGAPPPAAEREATDEPTLTPADRARLEVMFEEARRDASQGVRLKNELDRLGVFKQFEGRFLDLFRRAG